MKLALALLLALVIGFTAFSEAQTGPSLRIQSAAPVRMTNSLNGRAILSESDMAPGKTVRGEVFISNAGKRSEVLYLRILRQKSSPSYQKMVLLSIAEHKGNQSRVVFRGPLARISRVRLGPLLPREKRKFVFRATLSPLAGNDYQGSKLLFSCRWFFRRR